MTNSILTPLQLTTTANLLQNQGIASLALDASITVYTSTSLIAPFANTIAVGSTGNILSTDTLNQLVTLAANACPALSDSIPEASAGSYPSETLTALLQNTASTYLGNGDVSKFCQAISIASGYASITNQVINSAVNSQTYLAGTFTNNNNMISGGITAVNPNTARFAQDLKNLGGLIDLSNLENLGSPWALIQQLAKLGGVVPELATLFIQYGVSDDIVIGITNPKTQPTDVDQRAMYQAMTQVTGDALSQILTIFGVTTTGINTMADLLNPYKLFPNSFQSLTVTDVNRVSQNIYIDPTGTVNSNLATTLPLIALSSTV